MVQWNIWVYISNSIPLQYPSNTMPFNGTTDRMIMGVLEYPQQTTRVVVILWGYPERFDSETLQISKEKKSESFFVDI